MGLSEREVFDILTDNLEEKRYQFVVHCDYDSIREQYETHYILVSGRVPDILALSPNNEVIAIEVKGDRDVIKGQGQAHTYLSGAQVSYLAADAKSLERQKSQIHSLGVGTISVSSDKEVNWEKGDPTKNLSGVLEVRSRLRSRFNGLNTMSQIASIDLAHPVNFLAPPLWLANQNPNSSISSDRLTKALANESGLETSTIEKAIEGAAVLDFIDDGTEISLTESGRLGASILKGERYSSLVDLGRLKANTSNENDLYGVKPTIGKWLQQQYRLHPEFNAIYEVIRDFGPGEEVNLTKLSRVLIREHPNVFLRIFCTDKSREHARGLILEGEVDQLVELETFRDVIRQNLIQNFKRQLIHIGVLSGDGGTTADSLEDFVPEEYPWVPASNSRDTRLDSFR